IVRPGRRPRRAHDARSRSLPCRLGPTFRQSKIPPPPRPSPRSCSAPSATSQRGFATQTLSSQSEDRREDQLSQPLYSSCLPLLPLLHQPRRNPPLLIAAVVQPTALLQRE